MDPIPLAGNSNSSRLVMVAAHLGPTLLVGKSNCSGLVTAHSGPPTLLYGGKFKLLQSCNADCPFGTPTLLAGNSNCPTLVMPAAHFGRHSRLESLYRPHLTCFNLVRCSLYIFSGMSHPLFTYLFEPVCFTLE
jgi:hypothetical protein